MIIIIYIRESGKQKDRVIIKPARRRLHGCGQNVGNIIIIIIRIRIIITTATKTRLVTYNLTPEPFVH